MIHDKSLGEETVNFLTRMVKEDIEKGVYHRTWPPASRLSLTVI